MRSVVGNGKGVGSTTQGAAHKPGIGLTLLRTKVLTVPSALVAGRLVSGVVVLK